MRNMVIKGLVLALTVSLYFNVTQIIETKRLQDKETLLQETIDNLEKNQDNMQSQIDDLIAQIENDTEEDIVIDTCNKLYEIEIVVISESDDLNESLTHCTNEIYLGDALDELTEDLELIYDSRYDKDYIYGRLATSFYGVSAEYGEFYQITVDTLYSTLGLDFVVLQEGSTYQFTLVRWDV